MKAITVDFANLEITGETEILDWPKKYEDGMYYKTPEGFRPVAYCFKPESIEEIRGWLKDLKEKEQLMERYRFNIIHRAMMPHRIDQ